MSGGRPYGSGGPELGYGSRGERRGATVLDRDNHDAIVVFEVDVDNDHPTPRSEQEAESGPPVSEFRAK